MASSVASELILFIISLLAAGMVAGALYLVTQELSDGLLSRGAVVSSEMKTSFEIINDPENIPVVNDSYVFYVRNTGKTVLTFVPGSFVVMVDGLVVPPSNLRFSPTGTLTPYQIGEVYLPVSFVNSSVEYHKITLICNNGKRASMIFRVG